MLSGLIERRLVLESCFRRGSWGLLEMCILLTDDVVDFKVLPLQLWNDHGDLDINVVHKQLAPAVDIKLDYKEHTDLLLSLLMVKCPVSNK